MLRKVEQGFAVLMLSYACGASAALTNDGQSFDRTQGGGWALLLQAAFYGFALLLFLPRIHALATGAVRARWISALVLFAITSSFWSQDGGLTLRHGIALAATALYGIYFGSRFELREQLRLLSWTLLLLLAVSSAVAIAFPGFGVESGSHLGNWRGLFVQKNTLARIAVLSFITFLSWDTPRTLLRWGSIVFAIGVLGMTRSASAAAILAALIALTQIYRVTRLRLTISVPVIITVAAAASLVGGYVMTHRNELLATLGRDPTLTGRTQLWQAVWIAIRKHPFVGYGFNAFWLGMVGESASVISTVHWLVIHSHNGVLDVLLDLGACGVLLCAAAYLAALKDGFRFYRAGRFREHAWPLAFLTFLLLYNATESAVLQPNSVFLILLTAITVRLALKQAQPETSPLGYAAAA